MKQSILQNYFLEQFRRPTQRVKIPCGTKKPERIKLPKPAKIDRFEILYDLPKMKKFRDTRFDDPKPLIWDELKQEAKKMGAEIIKGTVGHLTYEVIIFNHFRFYRDGVVTYPDFLPLEERHFVAKDRKPDQMLAIMKALQ